MPETLLPCPFCGGAAEFERLGTKLQSTICVCTYCGCRLETNEEWDHGQQWNERKPDAEIARLTAQNRSMGEAHSAGLYEIALLRKALLDALAVFDLGAGTAFRQAYAAVIARAKAAAIPR